MKLSLFGASGFVGREVLDQCLEAGHEITLLLRTPAKLPEELRARVSVVEGDALDADTVSRAVPEGTDAVLFAIGVDKRSPEDLCTDVTRHILAAMPRAGAKRLVWVGGGSTLVPDDTAGFGEKFVELFTVLFMGLRHRDKIHQLELLEAHRDVEWVGLRPLQIRRGPRRESYRLGYDRFSGMSQVSAADVAHCMLRMLEEDTWLHRVPILQY